MSSSTKLRVAGALTAVLVSSSLAVAQQPAPLGTCANPATAPNVDPERRSLYVAMADGVRLAVDVFLPRDLATGTRLPTILTATRYWRAVEGQPPGSQERFWLSRGYAVVNADVRGTGGSFGQWYYPWSPQEVKDLGGLVAWVVKQPWSDGKVGSIGTSYTGNTAQLVGASNHPAVKAVVPRFMDFDVFSDLTYPGGLVNAFIINDWGKMVHAMDLNEKRGNPPRGVRPVDADGDNVLLGAAVQDHQKNPPLQESLTGINYRDDVVRQFGGATNDMAGSYRYRAQIERGGIPIFGWASWLDAGTSQGLINRFRNWSNPQLVVVGPWSHGGGNHASPYHEPTHPTDPPSAAQAEQSACFFDEYIKGKPNGMGQRAFIYYTLGEEKWKKTGVWPPAGISPQRWYLAPDHALARTAPAAATGSDTYRVDFEATTGTHNRWYTQLGGGDVIYPDRTEADGHLLTYTSPPLEADLEMTGQAIVTLRVASTADDGTFLVYLEDVDPSGPVRYVTEGMLRALHRKVSTEPPPYAILYPYHTFMRKDGQKLVPGHIVTLAFQLLPTSVLFKAGHRIRIALGGADKDTFLRIPAEGDVTWTVSRSQSAPSFIELPVAKR